MTQGSANQHEPLCRAKDVATLLRTSVSHVYRAAARGDIPSYRVGSLVRFRMSEIEAWLAQRRPDASEATRFARHLSAGGRRSVH